jgi:hypothetical protein
MTRISGDYWCNAYLAWFGFGSETAISPYQRLMAAPDWKAELTQERDQQVLIAVPGHNRRLQINKTARESDGSTKFNDDEFSYRDHKLVVLDDNVAVRKIVWDVY